MGPAGLHVWICPQIQESLQRGGHLLTWMPLLHSRALAVSQVMVRMCPPRPSLMWGQLTAQGLGSDASEERCCQGWMPKVSRCSSHTTILAASRRSATAISLGRSVVCPEASSRQFEADLAAFLSHLHFVAAASRSFFVGTAAASLIEFWSFSLTYHNFLPFKGLKATSKAFIKKREFFSLSL